MTDVITDGANRPNDPPPPGQGQRDQQPADRVDLPMEDAEEGQQGQEEDNAAGEALNPEEQVRFDSESFYHAFIDIFASSCSAGPRGPS